MLIRQCTCTLETCTTATIGHPVYLQVIQCIVRQQNIVTSWNIELQSHGCGTTALTFFSLMELLSCSIISCWTCLKYRPYTNGLERCVRYPTFEIIY